MPPTKTSPRESKSRWRRWFSLANLSLFSLIGVVLLWLLENFVGEKTAPTALLLYVPQHVWGILPAIVLGICGWKRQSKPAILSALALLLWANALWGFVVPWRAALARFQAPNTNSSLRVMTFNVALASQGDADALTRVIQTHNPDIVCLQESVRARKPRVRVGAQIARRLGDWHFAQAGDVTTLSRFPLVAEREFPLLNTRRILETHWNVNGRRVRVLNVHVSTAFAVTSQTLPAQSRLVRTVWNAQRAAQVRLEQIAPLRAALRAENSLPTIVMGDFNTPPRGIFYRTLTGEFGLRDAFKFGGWGTGPTFPANLPLLRIDYVFCGEGVRARRAFVAPRGDSDHRAVVADVTFTDTTLRQTADAP